MGSTQLALRALFPILVMGALAAQQPKSPPALLDRYTATEHMLAMRDGTHLHTIVVAPEQHAEPLPFVMLRTPYGVANWSRHFSSYLKELAEDGYVFVFQDIRGRFGSEGTFVMQRPLRATDASLKFDECTDAYDTIDWLTKNVEHTNGRVGMLGVSYDGWTTIQAAVDPHPALRAISPQASPSDMWVGDDFHHNGAFRLSYGFEYAAMMETSKTTEQFQFDRYDTFDWYLQLGSLKNVNEKFLGSRIPTWNDYVAHPDYDTFWQAQTVLPQLTSCTVPTLNVAGWWDQEDFYGPISIYRALERHDQKGINHLVVGPWNHGGWSRGDGEKLGAIPFGSKTAQWFREHVQAVWFRHWLKDRGELDLPEALTFEAGSNRWQRWDQWPPKQATATPLYMGAHGALTFTVPNGDERDANDEFVSDPAHPVPYRQRPIQATYGPGSKWREWLVEDQRFVKDRPDVLTWETEPLSEDVTIAGEITARMFCSTTGTDADWVVKLIDVYPDDFAKEGPLTGYCLMIANDVMRGRYRNHREQPEPWPNGQVVGFEIDLHTQNHTWKKGHRIMVQVQSTWFPLIDRNPQTYVPNVFLAEEAAFVAQTHRVFRSPEAASCVVLPIVKQ
jgi:uncharacterized protein